MRKSLFFFLISIKIICAQEDSYKKNLANKKSREPIITVTYDFSGGRFGDNLLAYLHAKWLAFTYKIPLLYRPFPYSSALVLSEKELSYSKGARLCKKQQLMSDECPQPISSSSCIFVCPYFPEIQWELEREHYFSFIPDYKNEDFRKEVRSMISLKEEIPLVEPPKNQLCVAVHLRDGGGFDDYELHFKHPLKVPPLTYYIESIRRVLHLFNYEPIYCHVFTDSLDPKGLIDCIQQMLPPDAPIIFNYRKEENKHDSNVLEDFFSLFNFDVLIRAESNYSIVPSLIHDYALVFSPQKFIIYQKEVFITEIKEERNEELVQKCMERIFNYKKDGS